MNNKTVDFLVYRFLFSQKRTVPFRDGLFHGA